MNVTDLIGSFFGGDNAAKLGQVVGLDAQSAQKALGVGLPMQLDALADHASNPQGQAQIADAIQNLPKFGSIGDALSGADGALNLQRAGELLAPALLGGKSDGILSAITSQLGGGASSGGVQKLMNMALPLMLSQLGQKGGLNAGNIGSVLGGLKGSLGGLGGLLGAGAAVAGLGNAASHAVSGGVSSVGGAAAGLGAAALGAAGMGGALTSSGLLDLLKGQFSGVMADKLGAAAGFGGSTAGRATQAALPVVLNALVNKGKTEAGAGDLLKLAGQFTGLSDANGQVNANLLGDANEVSRIETQGRGLLGGLFGNVDEIAGRLGTALGGSGTSASKLLSLLTPLVLSVLGSRAKAGNLNAGGLSGLLGGLGGSLAGLLPAGLGGLGALLGTGSVAAAAPAVQPTHTPAAAPRPPVSTPTANIPPASVQTTEKRGGFPWWIIPLIAVLGLGGCWLANQNKTTTATTPPATEQPATPAADGTFAISAPAANAELPFGGFTLEGTGKPGDVLQIMDGDVSLGNATVGEDGKWSLNVPSPTEGDHTYTVKGADGTDLGSLTTKTLAATGSAADCTKDYTLSITDGQTVTEPFRFGGEGQGKGYSVTVKRGDRLIGTKDIPLDASCGWAYQSKPGAGNVTYEVRPMGDAAAAPLSTVNLTVNKQ